MLNALKCFVTKSPSLILKRYNFFWRNNLFTIDFDWYKLPNLSCSFFVASSSHTLSNTKSTRQIKIVIWDFLSNFFQFSSNVPVGLVLGSIVICYSRSTKRSSILSFHNSKLWPLNFLTSILDLFDILLLVNLLHEYPLLH